MFNVFLSFFNDLKLQDDNMTEMHSISNFTIKNHEHYIPITLSLFGFDNEYISNIKGVNTSLSLSEDIKVRIVAKADIGALNKTRIEIIRAKESSPNIDHCTQSQSPHLFETHVCSFGTLEPQIHIFCT